MALLRYYISAHGLGHASRSCRIINTLRSRHPEIALEVVTEAPAWFLERSLDRSVPVRRRRLDAGLVQGNALEFDLPRTLAAWRRLLADRPGLVAGEARSLSGRAVTLVAADIPPFPFAAAAAAGIPAVGITNFSWDWICDHFRKDLPGFGEVAEELREDYRLADLLLRLPFHGDFPAFTGVEDLPLVARRSSADPEKVREQLGIAAGRRLGLVSFGGFAPPELELSTLSRVTGWTFLAEPELARRWPFLRPLPVERPYPDLVAAADAVVTKPGYGIVSECLVNRTAMLYVSRGDFPEQALLVDGLTRFGRGLEIDAPRLRRGAWEEALEELLAQPEPEEELATDGDERAADRLAGLAGS